MTLATLAPSRIVTDERVARYVAEKNQGVIIPPYTMIGVERDGKIIAGALFRNYTGHDVEVTMVGEGPSAITPTFIRVVGRYIIGPLGCIRATMFTTQPDVIEFCRRMGAQVEGVKRNGFGPGQDLIMLGVLREDWKFK